MKTKICLNDQQAKLLAKKGEILVLKVLDNQPPDENEYMVVDFDGKTVFFDNDYDQPSGVDYPIPCGRVAIPLQYPVETKLDVRETWTLREREVVTDNLGFPIKPLCIQDYHYKADYIGKKYILQKVKWHSPAIMPKKAIIKHVIVLENTVKRVQDIPPEEMVKLGIDQHWCKRWEQPNPEAITLDFINHFNAIYAKTIDQMINILHPEWKGIRKTYSEEQIRQEFRDSGKDASWEGDPYCELFKIGKV